MVGKRVENIEEIRAYMTAVGKMVGKRFENIEEIRAYTYKSWHKARSFARAFFLLNNECNETVRRCRKEFHNGSESVKDSAESGRPVTATGKNNVSKVREIIESDDSYIVLDITKADGISLSSVHFILKRILNVRKISARWIPPFIDR